MRVDDPSIAPATLLYRRVHPNFLKLDDNRRCLRFDSGAFQDENLSVHLGDVLADLGVPPSEMLANFAPEFALVSFSASLAREVEMIVCRDPQPDDPSHGLVVGKKTGGKKRRLARGSAWAVEPPNACHPPYD